MALQGNNEAKEGKIKEIMMGMEEDVVGCSLRIMVLVLRGGLEKNFEYF